MKKYTVSVCLLIKDENRYLSEWLEWHVGQGAEHFYIYDNGSLVPVQNDIPTQYLNLCTIVDWSSIHNHIQMDAYQDCLARFRDESEWIFFIDTDEFIRVIDGTPLPLFLSRKEYRNGDAVHFAWITYNANGYLTNENRPVRERFTKTAVYPPGLPQGKCAVRTETVSCMGAHYPIRTDRKLFVLNENGCIDPYPINPPTQNKLVIDHYFTRSYEEWVEKMGRGSCDPNYTRKNWWFLYLNPEMKEAVAEFKARADWPCSVPFSDSMRE